LVVDEASAQPIRDESRPVQDHRPRRGSAWPAARHCEVRAVAVTGLVWLGDAATR
jgi:hypothetical protein